MTPIPGFDSVRELVRTDRFVLLRATRASDRRSVLVKAPLAEAGTARIEAERALFETLAGSGVPKPLEIVRVSGRPALVLDDPGGEPLAAVLEVKALGLDQALAVGTALARLVARAHERDVILRAIAPAFFLYRDDAGTAAPIDLSLAARGPSAAATPIPLAALRPFLPYVSPEETGRMNRTIDHRSDLYSLGAILYEALTGRRPFESDDPLETVHWHIAKSPAAPMELRASIPAVLSRLVVKLLAKAPEERYQTAAGLAEDLARCARDLDAEGGTIRDFPLGSRDVSDRFLMPRRLYGRDGEIAQLVAAFDAVRAGSSAVLLVSGYPGIGKTALIRELLEPVVRRGGRFVSGKFDQVVRDMPYGALIQAFQVLVRQMLAERENRVAEWREEVSAALGSNAGVLTEVIPELEFVIGEQPPPARLGPIESMNRFQLVLQNFIGATACADAPLAVFLDDLQWADYSTIELLLPLLTNPDCRGFLLVGAYRDGEVDAAHPLARAVTRLRERRVGLHEIALGPLEAPDLTRFVADALRTDPAAAAPLADLVMAKTAGNPFFVIQFMKTLRERGLIEFDRASGRFAFDLDAIASAGMTDNVIDLMSAKIRRLPRECGGALRLAACIGCEFDLETLGVVSRTTPAAAADALAPALAEGLVVPSCAGPGADASAGHGLAFAFLHDRVQQAAYALIPDDEKKTVHLAVGRLLLSSTGPDPGERLLDVVHHLNLGRSLVADEGERLRLAELNLAATRRAKRSAAFPAARSYAEVGRELLEPRHFTSRYDLAFDLHLEGAECEYLCGRFDEANVLFDALVERARTTLDKVRVAEPRIVQLENVARYGEAMDRALEALRLLGIDLPSEESAILAAIDAELEAIRKAQGARTIASLADLPVATSPEVRAIMRLLTTAWSSAYIDGRQALTRLMSATIVRLSLEHGNAEESAYGYVTHAITVGSELGDYAAAYEWGLLALRVNDRFDDRRRRAKVHHQFAVHVNVFRRPMSTCAQHARIATRSGLESGDFAYAGYAVFCETWNAILVSRDLAKFAAESRQSEAFQRRVKMSSLVEAQALFTRWAEALRGRTASPLSLSSGDFDEAAFESGLGKIRFFATFLHVARLHLAILLGEDDRAIEHARRAADAVVSLPGTIWPWLVDFLRALALAGAHGTAAPAERKEIEEELLSIRDYLSALAESCPENFLGSSLLVHAEVERLGLRDTEAMSLYEEAIRHARDAGLVGEQALANLLFGRYWLSRENETVAGIYLFEARRLFAEWGASAVSARIDERHGAVLDALRPGREDAKVEGAAVSVDAATVAKAAHAIAVEVETDGLLRRLVRIAIENAGAERGFFIRERDGRLVVEAEGGVDPDRAEVVRSVPIDACDGVARGVVQYVRQTRTSVVLGDARTDERFSSDPRIASGAVRSILCVPVVHQGRFAGILYLENGLADDAFPNERIEVIRMLSTHAAIAIENARLYDGMRDEVDRRRRAEEGLRVALAEVKTLKDRLEAENVYLQEEIRREHNFEEIVGSSPALAQVLSTVERVAPTDATVLILGETGTGKELIARALHDRSARKGRPLVKVNCGAISAGLVESELFGHVKGAFTGAIEGRVGRFDLADGGTLFLDEVGELPPDTQVKLLRVLQEGEFEPVGSSRTVKVDVRIIAATNRDLEARVRDGKFRADLFYRLNVLPIRVPPLRERSGDVAQLVHYFVERFSNRTGKKIQGVSQETMQKLVGYSWPGNVRELQNVVERALVLAPGPVLRIEGPLEAPGALAAPMHGDPAAPAPSPVPASGGNGVSTLGDAERRHILAALRQSGGVIEGPRGAARILDLHPNTLRSRMKRLGLKRPASHESV